MRRADSWDLVCTLVDLAAVDAVCTDVRKRLMQHTLGADWFSVELLVREVLTNALVHGCRQVTSGEVACRLSVMEGVFQVAVSDPGPGFDWRTALAAPLPTTGTSGRGVPIYMKYADKVSFNDAGNQVVLERRLREPRQEAGDE